MPYSIPSVSLTSLTTPVPYIVTRNAAYSGSYEAWMLFDGNSSSVWVSNTVACWVKLDLGSNNSARIRAYTVTASTRSGETDRAPKDWTLQGSNNDSDWTTLDTVTNQTGWSEGESRTFVCDVLGTAYRYFKLDITTNNGDVVSTELTALQLLGTPLLVDFAPHNMTANNSPSPYVASASSQYDANFYAYKAFQGSVGTASYWLGTGAGVDWLKIDLGSGNAKLLYSYAIHVNTIPEPNRAPKDWTLEGSNNDSDWTTLDTRTSQTSWGSGEARHFVCGTYGTAYRYFRVNITANNGDANYTQIAELLLYEYIFGGPIDLDYLFSLAATGTHTVNPTGTITLTYPFSLLSEGYLPITASGGISYIVSLAAEGYLPITGSGNLSYLLSFLADGYVSPVGQGGLTYTYQLSSSGLLIIICNGNVTYNIKLSGNGRFINGTGGLTYTFNQTGAGTVIYSLAQLVYLMSIVGNAKLEITGTGSLGPFTFQMNGEGYEYDIDFDFESYLRRYINDPFGLIIDEFPVEPTYEEIPEEILDLIPD